MILSEQDILHRLYVEQDLVVTPILNPAKQIGPTSVDLRLGTEFKLPKTSRHTHLEPRWPESKMRTEVETLMETVRIGPTEPFVLHPDEFALGATLEYICLPGTLAARLEGRSTWARLGLQVHSTAGFVDPGFEGVLTFELHNLGTLPLKLFAGIRIAQICFYSCAQTAIPYLLKAGAKYAAKTSSVSSMFFVDYEFEVLRNDPGTEDD
jgi:dCTP deaminase